METHWLELLQTMAALPTAPFHEYYVLQFIQQEAKKYNLPYRQDCYGNLIVEYNGDSDFSLGIMAHTDHPGFSIHKQILPTLSHRQTSHLILQPSNQQHKLVGLLPLDRVGHGPLPQKGTLLGLYTANGFLAKLPVFAAETQRIWVDAPHLMPENGFAMYDIGERDVWMKNERLYGRAMDDLAGCAALVVLFQLLASQHPKIHLYLCFTRAEEVGLVGATGLAKSGEIPAELATISIEASPQTPQAIQGNGVVIRLGDHNGLFDPDITDFLMVAAEQLQVSAPHFKYQHALLHRGTCEATAMLHQNHPAGGLAIPLGGYHNRGSNGDIVPEFIHLDDWVNLVLLLHHIILFPHSTARRQKEFAEFDMLFETYRPQLLKKITTEQPAQENPTDIA